MKADQKQKTARTAPVAAPQDEIEAFVDGHQRLLKALATAERRAAEAEQELLVKRRELAATSAQALAEDPTIDPQLRCEPESAAFVEANLKCEQSKAAVEGCRRQLAKSDLGILGRIEQLKARRQAFSKGALKQFVNSVFRPGARAFAQVLRQANALEEALGEQIEELHVLPDAGDWRGDEKAVAVFEGNAGLRALADSLEQFRRGAEVRTLVLERSRMRRADFNPSNDARYRVVRDFQCYGKGFPAGSVVDGYQIDMPLLSKLYGAKFLSLIDPAMEGREVSE